MLRDIADTLERQKKKVRVHVGHRHITFVQARSRIVGTKGGQNTSSILDGSNDWELQAHIGRQFPDIAHTTLGPDIIMTSAKAKKIFIVKLTMSCEGRCAQANERKKRKKSKYEELIQECRRARCKAWNYLVEDGCRGFPAQSLGKMIQDVGKKTDH